MTAFPPVRTASLLVRPRSTDLPVSDLAPAGPRRHAVGGGRSAAAPARRGSDFAELSRRVKDAGLMSRRLGYYAGKITLTVALLAAGWTAFVLIGESWWQLATAVVLGVAFTQVAFLGHDAGHKQIARTRRVSYILGLLHANLAVGLSYGWWIDKHNRHHAHPNEIGSDPDIESGALVFMPGERRRSRLGRLLTRAQAYYFFPLLLLEGLNLHVAGVTALRERPLRARWLEAALLTGHLAAYATTVFVVLSPLQAVVFIAVQQGAFGLYMGCSFAPNHKGMPILAPGQEPDFLRRQVLTSRNIRGGRLVDFTLGGLNYQVEHHLFPSMPRPNLRRAQVLVRQFCQERGISYTETSLVTSYRMSLRSLHAVADPTGTSPR